ncbi:MAG: MBL fold metallo-hydrolase [Chitinivibrionales bacterium]
MKISFCGGAGSIGASCALLECGDSSLIIDCGIRMGENQSPLPDLSILNHCSPEAILVTHAHTDHSGALPVLAATFPHLPIVTTPPSIDLITILLNDSLKLMNSPEREADIPLFTKEQVNQVIHNFLPLHQGETRRFGPFSCTFYPAGHILGASMLHITTEDGHVLFTGDYSAGMQRTVGSVLKPQLPVDLMVTESTYGNRLHEERKAAETRFISQVREVIQRDGRVLIPSFAVGRAQEILLILRTAMRNGHLEKTPLYVDGMVRSVCNIYSKHERYVTRSLAHDIKTQPHPFFTDTIEAVHTPQQRQAALCRRPAIFVASSGMLSGGASVVYARELLRDERDAVLLTGYQDEEAPGRKLLALAEKTGEKKTVVLQGESIEVNATVSLFGLSAHADRLQMAGLVEACRPRTVVLVHGDLSARQALGQALGCGDCVCAHDGQSIERSYALRRPAGDNRHYYLPGEGDIPQIRALLGPPSSVALKASSVAQGWFGERMSGDVIERFVQRLIDLDLVRRHDTRRTMLYVLHPTQSEALSDEARLIEQLKSENPKGKLLEHCMRMRVDVPTTEWGTDGGFHTARMVLEIENDTLDSGIQHSSDKAAAEQIAARALLKLCEQAVLADIDGTIHDIDEREAARLKADNAKGLLLERCAKRGVEAPVFESRAVGGLWCTRVRVNVSHTAQDCDWYRHSNKKITEHGAAARMLSVLLDQHPSPETAALKQDFKTSPESGNPVSVSADSSEASKKKSSTDPYTSLILLKQHGYLFDYGFTDHGGSGPSHAPVFECSCWAQLDTGKRIESPVCAARSKKGARRSSAEAVSKMIGEIIETGTD